MVRDVFARKEQSPIAALSRNIVRLSAALSRMYFLAFGLKVERNAQDANHVKSRCDGLATDMGRIIRVTQPERGGERGPDDDGAA